MVNKSVSVRESAWEEEQLAIIIYVYVPVKPNEYKVYSGWAENPRTDTHYIRTKTTSEKCVIYYYLCTFLFLFFSLLERSSSDRAH